MLFREEFTERIVISGAKTKKGRLPGPAVWHFRYRVNPAAFCVFGSGETAGLMKRHKALRAVLEGKEDLLSWLYFVRLGDRLGVPPETFVDERFYLDNYGYLPYRIAFASYRKFGLGPNRLYRARLSRPYPPNIWRSNPELYHRLVDGSSADAVRLSKLQVEALYYLANILDVPLWTFFAPSGMPAGSVKDAFGVLQGYLAALSDVDAAVLAGMAKLLVEGPEEGRSLTDHVAEMLEYREKLIAGEKERG